MGEPVVVVDRERPSRSFSEGEIRSREVKGRVFDRLRAFRDQIEDLRGADGAGVIDSLGSLPEPWARRRAAVALIEAGIPGSAAAALDLIEELDRPMDRSWCLSALARRGGLEGDDLERALEMLGSPRAKRRVEALAIRAS
jgi:DNA-binding phage protein